MKHRRKKRAKKKTTAEKVRERIANYIAHGRPIHEAKALARHAFGGKK